ncbi:MAG: hypothetical protein HYX52_02760 [Chloroflexi bacterium]|nr:hypothetical protein [Chloroflexota bacterium]
MFTFARVPRAILAAGLFAGVALVLGACTPAPGATSTPTAAGPGNRPASASPVGSPVAGNPPGVGASPSPGPAAGPGAAGPSPAAGAGAATPVAQQFDIARVPSGKGNNVVQVSNKQDGRFRARGNVDFTAVRGEEVTSQNVAEAESSCTDCQSIAVAAQIVVYRRGASRIVPQNRAVALNTNCTRCVTVARAIQYVIPVDDDANPPENVRGLVREMNKELDTFERIKDVNEIDPKEAEARLNRVMGQFQELLQYAQESWDERRDDNREKDGRAPAPAATAPTVTVTTTPTATVAASPSVTPAPRATPLAEPSTTLAPSGSPAATPAP